MFNRTAPHSGQPAPATNIAPAGKRFPHLNLFRFPISHWICPDPTRVGRCFWVAAGNQIIQPDSLGRDSIDLGAARRLLDEQREHVLKQAALWKVAEQAAIEQDQAFRASIGRGIPIDAIPARG